MGARDRAAMWLRQARTFPPGSAERNYLRRAAWRLRQAAGDAGIHEWRRYPERRTA